MRIRLILPAFLLAGLLVAGCGNDTFPNQNQQQQGGGAVTGIILNAQLPHSAFFQGQQTKNWKVVDGAGNVLFSMADVKSTMGTQVVAHRREIHVGDLFTGKNPKEFAVEKLTVEQKPVGEPKEGEKAAVTRTVVLQVGDAAAAEMKAMGPALMKLVRSGSITILYGNAGS